MAKKIPYGISDYARIIKDDFYYIDKTRFIERVEAAPPVPGSVTHTLFSSAYGSSLRRG